MTTQRKSAAMVPTVLRILRQSRGMTITGVAQAIGTSRQHVSGIERGTWIPTLDTVERIGKVLDVPLWVILRMGERL